MTSEMFELTRGSYGKIYVTLCDNPYIIKRLDIHTSETHKVRSEINILKLLQPHKNIVTYLKDESKPAPYGNIYIDIHMEVMSCDVMNIIEEYELEARMLWYDHLKSSMMLALLWLYENNIDHNDFRPENILVKFTDTNPIFKLTDFGMAVRNETVYKPSKKRLMVDYYRPPEYWINWDDNSFEYISRYITLGSSDIWAFGITLWSYAHGCSIWPNEDNILQDMERVLKCSVEEAVLTDKPSDFSLSTPSNSIFYDKDVSTMLIVNPTKRFSFAKREVS